ncbi:beta-glucosidase 11-like [Vigna unguiculata]|uniref:Beta-glucosidase n=1 Tax=Vigna unguiculata TaxID=3917 RepID=A0A4D6NJ66_VIGUN|nr:beta-glucosidase 11-like [Vigna unguiculata]QCE11947.1 beta-glucosidase [Vigna unguiculata]
MRLMMKVFAVIGLVLLIVHPGTHALSRDQFPPDFVFGASTSAYQVEGAANEDGRKPSIWDTFSHAGNANLYAGDGDVACDHYHKYKEDVKLMANMGLEGYRFSISWSRLIPDGRGQVNPKGLQFYNNLIDELISNGIEAHATLYHWDLPQALEDEYGGWVSRRVVKDFTAYAEVCFREFGDRVRYWTTLNEANVHAVFGYDIGLLPPQRCSPSPIMNCSRGNSSTEPYLVGHHMLLAHASAARLYRKKYQGMQHGLIGFSHLLPGFLPQTNSTEDLMAVQRVQDFLIGWFMNPIIFGDYPDIMKKNAGSRLPSFTQKESNLVKGSIDFLGINFYYSLYVKDSPDYLKKENRDYLADLSAKLQIYIPNNTTKSEVPITPKILLRMLDSLRNAYGNIPIFIHENGQETPHNSSLVDWSRVNYLHAYIGSMVDALRSGLNVKGYFVWSFMDAFELLEGYERSYGLYYVDMNDPNLRRQPKLSAEWYSSFLKGKSMDPRIRKETQNNAKYNPSLHSATYTNQNMFKIQSE